MRNDGEGLYLRRKEGRGMGVKWTLHSLVPALLVTLITALLVQLSPSIRRRCVATWQFLLR